MSPIQFTRELERKSRVFGLFSDPTRVQILKFLATNPRASVGEIAVQVGMSVACVSHHLQLLKDNAVAECSRDGTTIYYCLQKDPFVKKLIKLIK